MRRLVSIVAVLLCAAVVALSQSTTPNLQLQLPAYQAPNWNVVTNQNWMTVDQAISALQLPYVGTWSSSTVYSRGQQVQYSGSLYASSIGSNFGNNPGTSPAAWQPLPGGSGASYPGVSTNGSNGLNISGAVATPQVTTGGAITGHKFTLTNLGTILADWTLDVTNSSAAVGSLISGAISDALGLKATLNNDISVMAPPAGLAAAKCDWNGSTGTDDSAAIQAIFDYVYDSGGKYSIVFPAGFCYVGTPIRYRGESFHGVSMAQSIIQGAPAKDAFVSPDPADMLAWNSGTTYTAGQGATLSGNTYVAIATTTNNSPPNATYWTAISGIRTCCLTDFHVHDVKVIVDRSTDPNGTAAWAAKGRAAGQGSVFANVLASWSGQTVIGPVGAADTSISLTAPPSGWGTPSWDWHNGYATKGWIKVDSEYMTYYGVSTTSCPNGGTFCLTGLTRGITLAGSSTTAATHSNGAPISPINPLAPTNTTDWIPAWTLGNCAFSFPDRDGSHLVFSVYHSTMDHISVNTPFSFGSPACALYLQALPYTGRFQNWHFDGVTFGIVQAPPFTNFDAAITAGISSDGNTWNQIDGKAVVPFVAWLGGNNTMSNDIFNSVNGNTTVGVTLHSVPCHSAGVCATYAPLGWEIDDVYNEMANGSAQLQPAQQFAGNQMTVHGGSLISNFNSRGTYPAIVDTTNSRYETVFPGQCGGLSNPGIIFYGSNNDYRNAPNGYNCVVDQGYGNRLQVLYQYTSAPQYVSPVKSAENNVITPEWLMFGNGGGAANLPYQSLSDLFFVPDQMLTGTAVPTGAVTKIDATAPITNKYVVLPASPSGSWSGFNQTLVVGQGMAATKGTFHIMLKTPSGATNMSVWFGSPLNTGHICAVTTTWTDCNFTYDFTSLSAGSTFPGWTTFSNVTGNTLTVPAQEVDIAWYAYVPNIHALTVDALTIAGNTGATTNQLTPIRAGAWSISSATSVAVTFATAMSATPTSCSVTPSASAATTGTPFATSRTTTGFTVNVPTSGTLAGTYLCAINNAN